MAPRLQPVHLDQLATRAGTRPPAGGGRRGLAGRVADRGGRLLAVRLGGTVPAVGLALSQCASGRGTTRAPTSMNPTPSSSGSASPPTAGATRKPTADSRAPNAWIHPHPTRQTA